MMYWDAWASPHDGLDSLADVSLCLLMDPMSKTPRYNLEPMHGADFDGFIHPGGYCIHTSVGGTGAPHFRLLVM